MRLALFAFVPAALLAPNLAQAQHPPAGHEMPAQTAPAQDPHADHQAPVQPAQSETKARAGRQPAPSSGPSASTADPHAGHAMPSVPAADPHAGHVMPPEGTSQPTTAAQLPVGDTPPPPVIRNNAADRVFDDAAMDRARDILAEEHGGARVSKLMINMAEYASAPEGGGYRWDVEGWYGGDINRVVVKSEGEGGGDEGLEGAEVQVLYSRAVGRYTDLQFGVRHDFEPDGVTYAAAGVESLLPYWFEAEAALYLSEDGDLLAQVEGSYDLRLTQRLVLQPQAELEFAAQDVERTETGKGLSRVELGLRLRYEIRREFAPYIGVSYERSLGRTADFARAAGEDVEATSFVAGLRAWF